MPGPVSTLSLAAAIVAVASAIPSALDAAPAALRARLASYGHAALTRPAVRAAAAAAAPPSSYGVRVSPLDFGGDPTGARDSAPALQACVDYCVNYTTILEPLGHMVGDASFPGGKYIANAGGCTIDLGGGEFKLAAPVVVPEYVGNINVGHGSLVADDAAFPADAFLFVVGVAGSCRIPQGSCNLAINFDELFFDGRRVASALQINNVMGTTVTDSYFLNFSAYGVQINDGHEVMMQHVWLGETPFDYPFSETDLPKAIAVQINGNDHFMRDIIVFSSKIGVEVNGAADYISGTHVWFPDNQAIRFFPQGVMAFHVTGGQVRRRECCGDWLSRNAAPRPPLTPPPPTPPRVLPLAQNRFDGCYIDGSRAVLEGSGLSGNSTCC